MPTRRAQRSGGCPAPTAASATVTNESQRAPASAILVRVVRANDDTHGAADVFLRHTHLNLNVYRRITLLPVPPHGVKMNRALTRSWPSRLRILSPALVGLSVIVVVPAESTSRTDHFSFPTDPPTGRATSLPAPATSTLSLNVPLLVSACPFAATLNPPPALMSLTRTVPASVPSDFHSSDPRVPSSAAKNNVPPTPVREEGS